MNKHFIILSSLCFSLSFYSCESNEPPITGEKYNGSYENTYSEMGNVILKNISPLNSYKVSFIDIKKDVNAKSSETITDIPAGYYKFLIEQTKGYINGYASVYNLNARVTEDNTLTITFPNIGDLFLRNKSSDPYIVTINDTYQVTINSGETKSYLGMDTGYYKIHVKQKSGYLFWATEKTYTGTLNKDGSLTVAFP